MKKVLISILLLLPLTLLAQLSVSSDLSYDYGQDHTIAGVDAVVLLEKVDSSALLSYLFTDSVSSEWHYHTASSDSLIASSVVNDTYTSLDSLQQGLYELRLDTVSLFYYVIDFSEYPVMVDTVWVDDSGDSCNYVRLYASVSQDSIAVYDKLNDSTHILSVEPVTTYLWSNETEEASSPLKQDAPMEDIEYVCIPYAADFFSDNDFVVKYSDPDTAYSEPYTAIAVGMSAIEATIAEDDGLSNELVSSTTTSGSAPLDVTYSITPEGAYDATRWWIWKIVDEQPTTALYREQEKITHTFSDYSEGGYRVKVMVANDYCQVYDSTEVTVTESKLEVPNVLFLGFGASGQFKVAYQSIDPETFVAAVYDRKGRLMHKWRDPSQGWDGRSPLTGAYVSPGAYYYSIRATGTDGEEYRLVGDLNVIREKGIR